MDNALGIFLMCVCVETYGAIMKKQENEQGQRNHP